MASFSFTFKVIKVMLWKHKVIRKRHFYSTLFEVTVPLIVYIFLFLYRKSLHLHDISKHKTFVWDRSISRLLYNPDTEFTRKLMSRVGYYFKLHDLSNTSIPNHHDKGYWMADMSEINAFLEQINDYEAVVMFHITDESKLNYTIKMKINADPIITYFGDMGCNYTELVPDRLYNKLLTIQWTIDHSYLDIINASSHIGHILELREFYLRYTKEPPEHIPSAMLACYIIALMYPALMGIVFVFSANSLLDDRVCGMMELLKMNGATTGMLLASYFIKHLVVGIVHSMLAASLMYMTKDPVLQHTNVIFMATALLLYYTTIVSMGFAVSYTTKTKNYSTTVAVFIYAITWIVYVIYIRHITVVIYKYEVIVYIFGLLPHVALGYFLREILLVEMERQESITHIWRLYLLMIVETGIFLFLSWFLDNIRPGTYGFRKNFRLLHAFCLRSKVESMPSFVDLDAQNQRNPKFFEACPQAKLGIQLVNISKVHRSWGESKVDAAVLSNFNLDVYKGEITILLGHNGAGKTTLMNIITGATTASEGKVYVNGLDHTENREQVSRQIGVCPQDNTYFPNFTLEEQLIFFAMLKNGSYDKALDKVHKLIRAMKLRGKGVLCRHLSGGMQRQLQLACALVGESKFLILDEPTAGLDLESRSEAWKLILKSRAYSTILLSTNDIGEAEALANRVAALHHGVLSGFGSPTFLKQALGSGYRLSLKITDPLKEEAIDNIVMTEAYGIFGTTKTDRTTNTLNYILPLKKTHLYPTLFDELEHCKTKLGIETIKVGVNKLDDVYVLLCCDVNVCEPFPRDLIKSSTVLARNKITGIRLYMQIAIVLFKRQLKATWNEVGFIFLNVLIPFIAICLILWFQNYWVHKSSEETEKYVESSFQLNLEEKSENENVILNTTDRKLTLRDILDDYVDLNIHITKPHHTNSESMEQPSPPDSIILRLHRENQTIKLFYNSTSRTSAATAINLLSNLMANTADTRSDKKPSISTYFSFKRLNSEYKDFPKIANVLIAGIIQVLVSNEVHLPRKELETGTRYLKIISGCPAVLYWAVTWLYDSFTIIIFLVLPMSASYWLFDYGKILSRSDFILHIFLLSSASVLAILPFIYIISFCINMKMVLFLIILNILLCGVFIPSLSLVNFHLYNIKFVDDFVQLLILASPNSLYTRGVLKMTDLAIKNYNCHQNQHLCFNTTVMDLEFCCAYTNKSNWGPYKYFEFYYGGGKELLALIVHIICCSTLVIWLETNSLGSLKQTFLSTWYNQTKKQRYERDVAQEHMYVSEHFRKPSHEDAMLVLNLHKVYLTSCYYTHVINGISFSVKTGECFGILGNNGAGKSTIFKMLNAEEDMIRGELYCKGHYLKINRSKYLKSLSYCPQFGGFDDFLNGSDNFQQLMYIRGLNKEDVKYQSKVWMKFIGLQKHAKKIASTYSGGCQRRLATAIALSSGAQVLLLDEPTSGIDLAAKRRVWTSIKYCLSRGQSVIITSHSMDEMEALCRRLALISEGHISIIGTPAELKLKHGYGFALKFHLVNVAALHEGAARNMSSVQDLKRDIQSVFITKLLNENSTMLHYRIMEQMPYSELFRAIEQIKLVYHDIIVDYIISESTLEEVYLTLAKN